MKTNIFLRLYTIKVYVKFFFGTVVIKGYFSGPISFSDNVSKNTHT